MLDSRAGRVLTPGRRSMVDEGEWQWISEQATGDVEHLVLGTSLPLLLGPALHHLESWNEAVCDGAWGSIAARVGEQIRRGLDLEHWPAFDRSFRGFCELLGEVAAGRRGRAPETITILSGDVHHAYLAEVGFPRSVGARSHVWQAVCSPFRNPLNKRERRVMRTSWKPAARLVGVALSRAAGRPDPPVRWRLAHDEPWFDNQVASLEFEREDGCFMLDKARPDGVLERVFERAL
jgi:hypothetical protein